MLMPPDTLSSDSVVFRAGKRYKAGKVKRFFFGPQYRKEWNTPVKAPVFDLEERSLKVVKQGGSRQTVNLRLSDSSGREYVLRSIDKTPQKALPEELRETLIADLFQDQVSTIHPYGAFTIAPLAEAAGVFHTMPELVFVPRDTAFGEFMDILGGRPVLFEQRPDGPMEDADHFGNPPNIVGTEKMLENRFEDNDHIVDERLYARSRLFDMLLGDWSRHEDQWRWGVFPREKGKIYKAIPRDRDHVFFRFNGLLPKLISQSWGVRHLRNFDCEIKNLKGLNNSARNLDRIILTSLTKEDWLQIADSLRLAMSDEAIESAIATMPEEVFHISGPDIISKLKSRREQLPEVAEDYYEILAEEVDVYGSDKHERFEVNRVNDETTEVRVFKINKEGEILQPVYSRSFCRYETKEVRLYGLDGRDEFYITGKAKKGIKVRVVGGEGMDKFFDSSYVAEGVKKTKFYDSKKYNKVYFYQETKDLRSDNTRDSVHLYPHRYRYDYTGPFLYPEYNVDDGIFLGAGVVKRLYGFRKDPYARLHKAGINFSTNTGALNLKYYGDFREIHKNWNLSVEAEMLGPKYVINYFGFGNEPVKINDEDIDFYRVKTKEIRISPLLYNEVFKNIFLGFGPLYENARVERTAERFISTPEAGVDPQVFERNHFAGAKLFAKLSNVEDLTYPENGFRWNIESKPLQQIRASQRFLNINSDLSLFGSPGFLKGYVTFATRLGGATNLGDFYFYQANTLSGTRNLRGYRRTRFYGRTSFYHNNEVRLKLFRFNAYLFPVRTGALAFYDYGRVWADGEKSNEWHYGYGPGLWLELFERYLFSATYGISEDGNRINIEFGFLF